jgi:hypothetical protein
MGNVINFNKEANDTKETWIETRFMIGHLTEEEAQTKTEEILCSLPTHLVASGGVSSSYYPKDDGFGDFYVEIEDCIEDSWEHDGEIKEVRYIQTVIVPAGRSAEECAAEREAYDYE